MSENCNHDCSSCSKSCSDRKIEHEKQNEQSNVKKIIGVVSGKGGVGKSFVTSLLSVLAKYLWSAGIEMWQALFQMW